MCICAYMKYIFTYEIVLCPWSVTGHKKRCLNCGSEIHCFSSAPSSSSSFFSLVVLLAYILSVCCFLFFSSFFYLFASLSAAEFIIYFLLYFLFLFFLCVHLQQLPFVRFLAFMLIYVIYFLIKLWRHAGFQQSSLCGTQAVYNHTNSL